MGNKQSQHANKKMSLLDEQYRIGDLWNGGPAGRYGRGREAMAEMITNEYPSSLMGQYLMQTKKRDRNYSTVSKFLVTACQELKEPTSEQYSCMVGLRTGDVLAPELGNKWAAERTPPVPEEIAKTLRDRDCEHTLFVTGTHRSGEKETANYLNELKANLDKENLSYTIQNTQNNTTLDVDKDLCLTTQFGGLYFHGTGGFQDFIAGCRKSQQKPSADDFVGRKNDKVKMDISRGFRVRSRS